MSFGSVARHFCTGALTTARLIFLGLWLDLSVCTNRVRLRERVEELVLEYFTTSLNNLPRAAARAAGFHSRSNSGGLAGHEARQD